MLRWRAQTMRFIEGMWGDRAPSTLTPTAQQFMHNEDHLPTITSSIFWAEVLRWSSQKVRIHVFCESL